MGKDEKVKLTCPVEMIITEKERNGIPTEDSIKKQKTLKEKLKEHYQTKKTKRNEALKNYLTPDVVNRFAVPFYILTVIVTWKIAFFDVMPLMYAGNDSLIFWQRVFSVFLLIEINMNWLGIRYVDSSYTRHLRIKAEEKERRDNNPYENLLTAQANKKDKPDSSCAKLLPVRSESIPQEDEMRSIAEENIEDPVKDNISKLTSEAQKANSEMELKNEQMKGISDLIKSSDDKSFTSKTSSKQSADKNQSNTNSTNSQDGFRSPTPKVSNGINNTKTVTYPYWSWIPCFDCNRTRPPRCHHCPVCSTCILKRDHHCFFAGNCVGYRNHRYFCVFLIWAWVCSMYATIHGFPYIYMFFWEEMSYFDVLFPITIVRWTLGYVPFHAALCVTTLTVLLYFDLLTTTFIYAQCRLIAWGLTSFEKSFLRRTLEIKDSRKLSQKVRAVFGRNWLINVLVPVHWLYEAEEDPVEWPHIQVIKHKP